MNRLSVEVSSLIFSFLVQRDQLECMTVCRHWYNIINQNNLFTVISVDRQEQFDQLLRRITLNPALGEKVRKLKVALFYDRNFDKMIFTKLFPNLRILCTIDHDLATPETESLEVPQTHPWCQYIENIVEEGSGRITNSLLHSGLCQNLTSMSVQRNVNYPVPIVIDALRNAPALKRLTLKGCRITFHDLELLHTQLPTLDSILILESDIDCASLPQDIQPIASMKSFRCYGYSTTTPENDNRCFEYISQKYTHLEELGISIESFSTFSADDDYHYYIQLLRQKSAIVQSYLETLSPRLKSLTVYADALIDPFSPGFDLLDTSGCQIEKLNFGPEVDIHTLYALTRSNQVQYIQSLTIDNLINDKNLIGDKALSISVDWLSHFTTLTELALHIAIPNPFPYGHTFAKYLKLKVDGVIETCVLPSIKKLTISNITIDKKTDVFISRTFPNLKHLKLVNCFDKGESLEFPKFDLCHLEIVNRFVRGSFPVLVVTLGDGQRRIYNARTASYYHRSDQEGLQNEIFTLRSATSQPFHESEDIPKFTIVCNSVNQFSMMNYEN